MSHNFSWISYVNRVFGLLRRPDATLERWLVRTVATFDTVITMGHRAVGFFRQRGLKTSFHVVSGGIESCRFHPQDEPAAYDMVFVGRLAPIKRVTGYSIVPPLAKLEDYNYPDPDRVIRAIHELMQF